MINYTAQFLTIAGLHALAVASPGPDFAITVKQSVRHGRAAALWTAVGIGSGICLHTAYTLLGFGLLVKTSWLIFTVMKSVAAIYLGWLGVRALWPRKQGFSDNAARVQPDEGVMQADASANNEATPARAYALGFWTNALNPKATLFFVSVFSVVVNPGTSRLILAGYGIWMAVTTALWFSVVAIVFTHTRVRGAFLRLGPWFDRAMGVVLLTLCVVVAFTSAR